MQQPGEVESAPGRPYRPKDYAVIPSNFGRDRALQWRPPASEADHLHSARVIAARLQHGLMYALARAAADTGSPSPTDAELAGRLDMSADRLGRIRRGDLPMRTEELGLLCTVNAIPFQRVVAMSGLQPPDLVRATPSPAQTTPRPR